MTLTLPINIDSVKGFLSEAEGEALYATACDSASIGPCLEIGSYCGKSTIYLGLAAQQNHSVVFALDHHLGSAEQQPGQMFHDPDLMDPITGQFNSFRVFRENIERANLTDVIVPVVATSSTVAKGWQSPLGMLFIDGGHSWQAALEDYQLWVSHVLPNGILAIHDIYPHPDAGGQAPYSIYKMAQASGLFETLPSVGSLGLLRRL